MSKFYHSILSIIFLFLVIFQNVVSAHRSYDSYVKDAFIKKMTNYIDEKSNQLISITSNTKIDIKAVSPEVKQLTINRLFATRFPNMIQETLVEAVTNGLKNNLNAPVRLNWNKLITEKKKTHQSLIKELQNITDLEELSKMFEKNKSILSDYLEYSSEANIVKSLNDAKKSFSENLSFVIKNKKIPQSFSKQQLLVKSLSKFNATVGEETGVKYLFDALEANYNIFLDVNRERDVNMFSALLKKVLTLKNMKNNLIDNINAESFVKKAF